jgi:6-pyruvoyltetrahydropterin/6-carboxytetrahydropterin synthase
MISVTKIFEFEAAHYLPNHPGKCKNLHGHSYKLEIEIMRGEYDDNLNEEGMVMDFGELKELVEPILDDYYDHKILNESTHAVPTAENMVREFASLLRDKFKKSSVLRVVRIRLWETSSSYAEWRESI